MALESIGLAASIIALIQLTGKLTAMGYDYIGGVKRASKDCKDLVYELNSLSGVLNTLQDHIDKPGAQPTAIQRLNEKGGPIEGCMKDLTELQSKLGTRDGLKRLIDNLKWPFKETETLQKIERIERHKNLFMFALTADHFAFSKASEVYIRGVDLTVQKIDRCAHNTNLVVHDIDIVTRDTNATVYNLQGDIKADITVQEEIRLAERRKKILEWLYPGAFDTKHMETSKKRQKNTGGWIFELPGLQKWAKQESDSNILCGYGIPGAGKTFLSSLVIDHFEALAQMKNYGIAYIYFDYSDQVQQQPTSILASLVKQLACRLQQPPAGIEQLYDKCFRERKGFTLEDLYMALQETQKSFSQVFLVFDALDECGEEQRSELLPFFERLGTESGMCLFITSRPYSEDIQDCFSNAGKIEIYAQEGDIRTYVKEKIGENRRARRLIQQSKCMDRTVDGLVGCAEGMFLLVRFHVEYICQQTSARQVLIALDKIKKSSTEERPLNPTYDRAIQNIKQQGRSSIDLALKIFSWLIKAARILTVEEIRVAVSVEPNRYELDELDLPDRATLLEVCAGLVTIDMDTDTVRLAHYTVKEYLVENYIVLNTDLNLAIACTTYLSFNVFTQDCMSIHERFIQYPFLRYAAQYLQLHLSCCDESLSADSFLRFLESPGIISSWRQASSYSPYRPFPKFITTQADIPTKSPLSIACEIGHKVVVQRLIEKGFDISSPVEDSALLMYPLHFAARFGRWSLAQFLLEKGADISSLDKNGSTALHYAVSNNEETVRVLIENGADISAVDGHGYSVLHVAVRSKNKAIIRLLINKEVDVSVRDRYGKTAMENAIIFRNYGALLCFVEAGVNLSTRDVSGNTGLHWTLRNYLAARILVENRADLSVRSRQFETVLHQAVVFQEREMIKLLVESGAYILNGLHMIALILLEHDSGADISTLTKIGDTVLHLAARYGNEEAVRILLQHGFDISTPNKYGDTALHLAARYGIEEMVQILLQHGSDISTPNKYGDTALHLAAQYGKKAVVRAFVEHGTDVSALNKNGSWAALCGSLEVFRSLNIST